MKKTFNRLLAATVAIPVALGQVLAISANAAEAPAALKVTADKLLKVEPATGFPETVSADADTITYTVESDWNTTLAKQLNTETSNKTVTVDAKKFVAGINSANYYVELLKKAVNASENPTATVKDGVVTISGTADFSAATDKLAEKLDTLGGYENFTLDTSILTGVAYTATIKTDFANSKSVDADLSFTANGKTYGVSTATEYANDVCTNLAGQVTAAVDQKVKELAAEYNMTEDEVRANADFDIAGDVAALKAETDKLSADIAKAQKKYDSFKNLTKAAKSYDSADAALAAAVNYLAKNVAAAANQPKTVDGMVAKYGANFDNGVASVNSSLKDAGVNVEIAVSSADVAALLKSATKVTIGAAAGTYTAELEITDAEKAEVEKYVEEQVAEKLPEKTVVSVDTVKTVTVSGAADGVAAFDVTRDVTVVLKDKDTTTTTTTTTGDSGTTTTVASGATTDVSGATTDVSGATTDVSGATTDVSGATTDVSGATTDVSGATTDVSGATTDVSGDTTDVSSETTTVSSDTTDVSGDTTTDGSETTTDGSGTTTETLPTGVSSVEVKTVDAETAENIYLSDEESFNVAGLIESVTLHLENGEDVTVDPATAIDFEMTPAEAYETVTEKTAGKVYFDGEVGLKYKGEEDVEITDTVKVAVALKGDTTLDGKVDATDLFETAYYVALQGAGKTPIFDTVKNGTALESKLAYLASDIDTESKAGENTEDGKLDATDMLYTAVYQAYNGAGNHIDWAEAIKMANGGK
ncbi:MAG: hypothetical protein KH326_01600 [Ruminococcus callidus]|uniref:hypothetical protein n=1 Tax=Ruminococcus callidus TaxID=40519 RepID=UPI0023F346D0|nr:hypothetical protein [Ruminococcus callidus]MBS6595745.1 hypothetical protein [Ruminococcus callidus]